MQLIKNGIAYNFFNIYNWLNKQINQIPLSGSVFSEMFVNVSRKVNL